MDKDSKLLDKVIIFLIALVGIIILFNNYQFYNLSGASYLFYLSVILVLALVGLVAWFFIDRKSNTELHQAHPIHHKGGFQHGHSVQKFSAPFTFAEKLTYGIVALIAVLIFYNQLQISQASSLMGFKSGLADKLVFSSSSTKTSLKLTGDPSKDALSLIPKGTRFYSQGLGVSFDDPIKSLEVIAQLDPAYGRNKIQLTPDEKARYIKIGTIPTMGCEYCCGATTAVTKDGRPTCGCKHSWATRGLLAYLVKNYPQLSDDEIMHSLAEWKVMFFPKQMLQRYVKESQTGQYTPDIKALLLDADQSNIKSAVPVASAGNTQSNNQVAADINSLPSQVGGC